MLHALSQWDIFLQHQSVDGCLATEINGERRLLAIVCYAPISIIVAIGQHGRRECLSARLRGLYRSLLCQVVFQLAGNLVVEGYDSCRVDRMDSSFFVHRHIQQHGGIVSYTTVIKVNKMFHTLHLVVLTLMVEPSRADRNVALSGNPGIAIGMAILQLPVVRIARIYFIFPQERPVGSACIAIFIAYPAAARTSVGEDDSLRLIFLQHAVSTREIIVSTAVYGACFAGSSIVAVTSIGTVKPYFKDIAILCEQFLKLSVEIFPIKVGAIESLMTVPG